MKKKPFLTDPEVGCIYWEDALKKYKSLTTEEMLFDLMCEVGDRVFAEEPEVIETRPDESQRTRLLMDKTMFRIYHTLQTILDKMKAEKAEKEAKEKAEKEAKEAKKNNRRGENIISKPASA